MRDRGTDRQTDKDRERKRERERQRQTDRQSSKHETRCFTRAIGSSSLVPETAVTVEGSNSVDAGLQFAACVEVQILTALIHI